MGPSQPDQIEAKVNSAIQKYLEQVDEGHPVDQAQFLAEHADIAEQLRSFLMNAEDLRLRLAPSAVEVSTNRSLNDTFSPNQSSTIPEIPEVFGRYRVQRLLGQGAMGAVYLATDTQLGRLVALKVPRFDRDRSAELLERFYREARTAATLRHPRICPVYDVGDINGQHFISMAYIEGRSLAEILKKKGPQSERQALSLARKLATALQEAHNQGVVHRDLKPGNIMIDPKGEPIVMDFGLACQVQEGSPRLTQSGMILGSPAYMSPEQLEASPSGITPAADQFALGVILYELLTGELPFRGSISAVISQIVTKPAPSPKVLIPSLDPRTDALCQQLLAKSAKNRFPSMQAVADQLTSILKDLGKTEPSVPSLAQADDPLASQNLEPSRQTLSPLSVNPQKQVETLVRQGELPAALEILKPLAAKKPGKLTDWAKDQQAKIQADLTKWERDQPTLCRLAAKLIRKHDYKDAQQVLAAIPAGLRTDECLELLDDAEQKEEETRLLLKDIEEAIRKEQPKELVPLVKRYLQLKPGHKVIQALFRELQTYGADHAIRIRRGRKQLLEPAEQLWNPVPIGLFVAGLGLFCGLLYFATLIYQTPNGTVIIEVFDPRIEVQFANQEITASSSGQKFRLKTTEKKTLQLELDGVTVDSSTQEITVTRNETKLITARIMDGQLDLIINSQKQTFSVPEKPKTQSGSKATSLANAATTPPDQSATTFEEIDLLAAIDPSLINPQTWAADRTGNVLTSTLKDEVRDRWGIFEFPSKLTGDYDLEIEAFLHGADYIQIQLPLDDRNISLSLRSQGTTLHNIDGQDQNLMEVAKPFGNPELRFTEDVFHTVSVSVRHQGENVTVKTLLDGLDAGQFSGPRSRLATPGEKNPEPHRVRLMTHIHRQEPNRQIKLRKVVARIPKVQPAIAPQWTELFNGQNLIGWTPMATSDNFRDQAVGNSGWIANGSRVICDTAKMGWLRYDQPYGDFELELEFKLPPQGNSGLLFRSTGEGYLPDNSYEIQMIDDAIPAKATQRCGALQGIAGPESSLAKPIGEWNQLRVVCLGNRLQSYLNGQLAAEAVLSKPLPAKGYLGLYNWKGEAKGTEFRNIRVRPPTQDAFQGTTNLASPSTSRHTILDIDFRNGLGGFREGDEHHILAVHQEGEYRYLCKKTGHWFGGLHPALWAAENNQLSDFALELDCRFVGSKKGALAIRFGRVESGSLSLCLNQDGQIKLVSGDHSEIVPYTGTAIAGSMETGRKLRLVVDNRLARVSLNDNVLLEHRLKNYSGGPISLWVFAEETPFDTRWRSFRLERIGPASQVSQPERLLKGHTDIVRGVAFLPDHRRAVSVGHGQAFKLWDYTTGELLHDFTGHTANVTSVSVSADGTRAVTGCDDHHVRLWDLEKRTLLKTLKGHTGEVISVCLSKDGQTAFSASHDQTTRQWSFKPGGRSRILPSTFPSYRVALSPPGNVLAVGNFDGTLILRNADTTVGLSGHPNRCVEGIVFTPDEQKLLTSSHDGTVRVWDLRDGKELHRFDDETLPIESLALMNDGRHVIAGGRDQTLKCWNLETGDPVFKLQTDVPVTHRMALSADNQHLLTGGGDDHWRPAGKYDLYLWKVPSPPAPPQPMEDDKLTLLLDADFSQGLHGFGSFEDADFRMGLVDHEWQYAGKNATWGNWRGAQPVIQGQPHHDFVLETEARWHDTDLKNWGWGLGFGFVDGQQDVRLHVSPNREVWIAQWLDQAWHDRLPPTVAPTMRPATEHNTVRLEVVQGKARVFVNGQFVGEADLPKYVTGNAALVLFPQDTQPDIRFRRIRFWHLKG